MSSTSRTYSMNAPYHSFAAILCSKILFVKQLFIVFQQDNNKTNCTMIKFKRAENHVIFLLRSVRDRK